MNQPTLINEPLLPGENEVDRVGRLRARGLTVKQVAEARDRSERQIYRILRRGKERPRRNDFKKWSLWSSKNSNEPIAMSRYLFETDGEIGWLQDEASWAWQVHSLSPELDRHLVSAFSRTYQLIDNFDESDRPHRARLVDLALLCKPWMDDEHRRRYFAIAPARNQSDLRYIAHVAWYLEHTSGKYAKRVTLISAPIVEDQVGTLIGMVEQIQDDSERDDGESQMIDAPGGEERN